MSIAPIAASARVAAPPAWAARATTARSKPLVLLELKRFTHEFLVLRLLFRSQFLQQVLQQLLAQLLFEFTGFRAELSPAVLRGSPVSRPTSSLAKPATAAHLKLQRQLLQPVRLVRQAESHRSVAWVFFWAVSMISRPLVMRSS